MKLIEPYTTTHDFIPAKNGRNDEDRTTDDCISRQAAIDALCKSECGWNNAECRHKDGTDFCVTCDNVKIIKSLPSVQPEPRTAYWTKDIVGSVVCSYCGGIREDNRIGHTQWCNCCGCFMRGEEND